VTPHRRLLLVILLVYIGLDLSSPEMPGAFVFDPADSVESVTAGRTQLMAKIVVLPTPGRDSRLPSREPHRELRDRLPAIEEVAHSGLPVVSCLPRATCAPSRLSEDSH
jgi:hypothetical protein